MQKTQQTGTKLLIIALTTVAIIAAVTTISISAARPAFAKLNCNEDISICSGGQSNKQAGLDALGGGGGRNLAFSFSSGGSGGQLPTTGGGTLVGGSGHQTSCDPFPACTTVGGTGRHLKGPGGNSD